jgi:hypothetical protein
MRATCTQDCRVSTGIHDALTFGCGELDKNGFWEFPCPLRARAAEIKDGVEEGSYWPHTAEWLEKAGFGET